MDQDFSDFGRLLQSIGGWTIGCINHVENAGAVDRAYADGLVQTRIHYAPIEPAGWECFELTDLGIEMVRHLKGEAAAVKAERARKWYRDKAWHWQEVNRGRMSKMIPIPKEEQVKHDLTVIAEECEENWTDWVNDGFDGSDVLDFIRETGRRAREAIIKLG